MWDCIACAESKLLLEKCLHLLKVSLGIIGNDVLKISCGGLPKSSEQLSAYKRTWHKYCLMSVIILSI